ncbi:MAG: 1-acyl-sn-glycerol-3-phosphate acyltransferase [Chitinophagaceae bacterium]|nr:1-acyl-sn-glycerol-3-phosphate acyltransferase [Chitinophagaceae bacterium]
MLYQTLKILVGLFLKIFCRHIEINKPEILKIKGPVLLASNHPNSLLDAIIIDVLFEQPVYSLTRGDVFKKRFIADILTSLRMLPVYRASEGNENLSANYETFDACKSIFKKNGIIQIFSEGLCINEWRLRPLKKGTARLALSSWEDGIPLQVIPVGINYSSFRRFGKNVFINFGNSIHMQDINQSDATGLKHMAFNNLLNEELTKLVFDIKKNDIEKQERLLKIPNSILKKCVLFIPSAIGFLIHSILYIPIKLFALKKAGHNDHFDSLVMVLLFFLYPLFLLLVFLGLYFSGFLYAGFLILFLLPFTAWAYVQIKPQLDKQ